LRENLTERELKSENIPGTMIPRRSLEFYKGYLIHLHLQFVVKRTLSQHYSVALLLTWLPISSFVSRALWIKAKRKGLAVNHKCTNIKPNPNPKHKKKPTVLL